MWQVIDDRRVRTLQKQLRATQIVALLCVVAIATLAWRQSQPVTELRAGDTVLAGDLEGISAWSETNAALGVMTRKGTAVRLDADEGGTSLSMRSGGQSLFLIASHSGSRVSLIARGAVRSQLAFDTNTGAVRLIQRIDGENGREVVTDLAGPIR